MLSHLVLTAASDIDTKLPSTFYKEERASRGLPVTSQVHPAAEPRWSHSRSTMCPGLWRSSAAPRTPLFSECWLEGMRIWKKSEIEEVSPTVGS